MSKQEHRRFTAEQKLQILREAEQPGVTVSEVCRRKSHDPPLDLYRKAIAAWGEEGLMDIIQAIGFYTFVSMTLNAFNVPTGEGDPTPFPRDD